jgi:hypothetical protein
LEPPLKRARPALPPILSCPPELVLSPANIQHHPALWKIVCAAGAKGFAAVAVAVASLRFVELAAPSRWREYIQMQPTPENMLCGENS